MNKLTLIFISFIVYSVDTYSQVNTKNLNPHEQEKSLTSKETLNTIVEPWNVAGSSIKATENTQNIYQQGNVGIGPVDMIPEAKLDIRGDALINGITVGLGKGNLSTNAVVGHQALINTTTGDNNVAMGTYALYYNTTGNRNVAIRTQSLMDNSTGGYNVAMGYDALYHNTTGNNNVAIGYYTLEQNKVGSNNTAIGHQAGANVVNANLRNTTCIGYQANAAANNMIRLGNESITRIEGQVNFSASSDQRLKDNIKTISLGLDFINKVRPVEYIRKNNEEKTKEWGVIAQELQQTITNEGYQGAGLVQDDHTPDHYLSVRYTDLIAPMIKAIQELSKQNQELSQENKDLKKINDQIKMKDNQLEQRIEKLEEILKKTIK